MTRITAFNVYLYTYRDTEAQYRRELNELCEALDAQPSTRYVCRHILTGTRPGADRIVRPFGTFPVYGPGNRHSVFECGQSTIRIDHDVTLVAKDRSWIVQLSQPYETARDPHSRTMPDGIVAEHIGSAPYAGGKGCEAYLVGATDVVAKLLPAARAAIVRNVAARTGGVK